MSMLIRLFLIATVLVVIAGCPPRGVGPTPEAPDIGGEYEVLEWEGSLPDLPAERLTWVAVPEKDGVLFVAVDIKAGSVRVAVMVPNEAIDQVKTQLNQRQLFVNPLDTVIIGGLQGPCCRPPPPPGRRPILKPEFLKFVVEVAFQVNRLTLDAIKRGILQPRQDRPQ